MPTDVPMQYPFPYKRTDNNLFDEVIVASEGSFVNPNDPSDSTTIVGGTITTTNSNGTTTIDGGNITTNNITSTTDQSGHYTATDINQQYRTSTGSIFDFIALGTLGPTFNFKNGIGSVNSSVLKAGEYTSINSLGDNLNINMNDFSVGLIETTSSASGITVSTQGSGKSIQFQTNGVIRGSVQDDGLHGNTVIVGSSVPVIINAPLTGSTYNFNLPTSAGSSGAVLRSGGGGTSSMTWDSGTGTGGPVFDNSPIIDKLTVQEWLHIETLAGVKFGSIDSDVFSYSAALLISLQSLGPASAFVIDTPAGTSHFTGNQTWLNAGETVIQGTLSNKLFEWDVANDPPYDNPKTIWTLGNTTWTCDNLTVKGIGGVDLTSGGLIEDVHVGATGSLNLTSSVAIQLGNSGLSIPTLNCNTDVSVDVNVSALGALTYEVAGWYNITCGAASTWTVGGDLNFTMGFFTITAGGGIWNLADITFNTGVAIFNATGVFTVSGEADVNVTSTGTATVNGAVATIISSLGDVNLNADVSLNIECVLGSITETASTISISGSAALNLKSDGPISIGEITPGTGTTIAVALSNGGLSANTDTFDWTTTHDTTFNFANATFATGENGNLTLQSGGITTLEGVNNVLIQNNNYLEATGTIDIYCGNALTIETNDGPIVIRSNTTTGTTVNDNSIYLGINSATPIIIYHSNFSLADSLTSSVTQGPYLTSNDATYSCNNVISGGSMALHYLGEKTVTSTAPTIYTDAYGLYVKAPVAGTSTTFSNILAAKFDGAVEINGTVFAEKFQDSADSYIASIVPININAGSAGEIIISGNFTGTQTINLPDVSTSSLFTAGYQLKFFNISAATVQLYDNTGTQVALLGPNAGGWVFLQNVISQTWYCFPFVSTDSVWSDAGLVTPANASFTKTTGFNIQCASTDDSTSLATGSVKLVGGLGVAKNIYALSMNTLNAGAFAQNTINTSGSNIIGQKYAAKLSMGNSDSNKFGQIGIDGDGYLEQVEGAFILATNPPNPSPIILTYNGFQECFRTGGSDGTKNQVDIAKLIKVNDNTDATSTTTGCAQFTGGIGVAKHCYAEGFVSQETGEAGLNVYQTEGSTLGFEPYACYALFTNTDNSNRALFGIDGSGFYGIHDGAALIATNSASPTPVIITYNGFQEAFRTGGTDGTAAQVDIAVELNANDKLNVTGLSTFLNTTDSTTYTNGSVVFNGGIGVAKNINCNGILQLSTTTGSTLIVSSLTNSFNTLTGCAVFAGGIGVGLNLYVGGTYNGTKTSGTDMFLNSTDDSISTGSGSLVSSGGISAAKTIQAGNNLMAQNFLSTFSAAIFGQYNTDANYCVFTGGSADGAAHGGRIICSGSGRLSGTGDVQICAGYGSTGNIQFFSNNDTLRGSIDGSGIWTVGDSTVDEFYRPFRVFGANNTTAGNRTLIDIGVSDSANNTAQFGLIYQGNGSASNQITIGMNNVNDIFLCNTDTTVQTGPTGLPFRYYGSTFTPAFSQGGMSSTTTYYADGYYTVMGKEVTVYYRISVSTTISGNPAITLTLPVTGTFAVTVIGGSIEQDDSGNPSNTESNFEGFQKPYFPHYVDGSNFGFEDNDGTPITQTGLKEMAVAGYIRYVLSAFD